jgi:hypothetical protein
LLTCKGGWNNWRDFFDVRALRGTPTDMSLASHVRKVVTVFLFDDFENGAARTTTPENAPFLIKQ